MKRRRTAVVLGRGSVGTALARALPAAGVEVVGTWTRSDGKPLPDVRAADLVFLAVSDDAVEALCERLSVGRGQLVVHLAGALDLTALDSARKRGARVGSLHPLRAMKADDDFAGATAGISGDGAPSRTALSVLARDLGMTPLQVPARSRPLYHAAAVLAAGAQVALFSEAIRAFRKATKASEREAREALLPLTESAIGKLRSLPPARAITGPAVRGDQRTIAAHRRALPKDALRLYDELTRIAVSLRKKPSR